MWKTYSYKPRRFKIEYFTLDKFGETKVIICKNENEFQQAMDDLSKQENARTLNICEIVDVDYEE